MDHAVIRTDLPILDKDIVEGRFPKLFNDRIRVVCTGVKVSVPLVAVASVSPLTKPVTVPVKTGLALP